MPVSIDHSGASEVRSLAEAIGDETFEWSSPDGLLTCKFGRPKGFVGLDIADALGPQREGSSSWVNTYRALAGIREWNGNPVMQPRKAIGFQALLSGFASQGESCADLYLNNYVFTFHKNTNPAIEKGLEEIEAEGYGSEDADRVLAEVAKEPVKKSRDRHTSEAS